MSVLEQLTRERDQALRDFEDAKQSLRVTAEQRDKALREKAEAIRQLNIADCAHAVTVHEWKQRASEAEAARARVMSDLVNADRHIETLREALLTVLQGCDGDDWLDSATPVWVKEALRKALATTPTSGPCPDCDGEGVLAWIPLTKQCPTCNGTGKVIPTSGLMEKVRALCAVVEKWRAKKDCTCAACVEMDEALAALYAELPWLKGESNA